MKEDIDVLIEEKWRKQDEFATFISAIEKLPNLNEKKLALHQGNDFIYAHNTFFDKNYEQWIKEILPLSISVTLAIASTFTQ